MKDSTFRLPDRALIGMVHLPPLPGSPTSQLPIQSIAEIACRDARLLAEAGFDAVMVENFGDAPFRANQVDPHTVACMTVVARAVRREVALPIGINVLRNDVRAALAIATVCEGAFVRVNVHTGAYATDQGIVEGKADETLRYRQHIGTRPTDDPSVAIWADVHVKHASPLLAQRIGEAAEEAAYRGRADGLIVSGTGTGRPTDLEDLRSVRETVPDKPVYVGSGANLDNIGKLLKFADGLIVGTSVKTDGKTTAPVDVHRATAFVKAAKA